MRPFGANGLACHIRIGDEVEEIAVRQLAAAQDDGASHFNAVVDQEQNEVKWGVKIVGKAFGERNAHRHFHFLRQPLQDFPHECALALGQEFALVAVERGNRKVDILAVRSVSLGCKPRQPLRIAEIPGGQTHHLPPHAHVPVEARLDE